jgi:hypothetical protein
MEHLPAHFSPMPHVIEAAKAATPDLIGGGLKAGIGAAASEAAPGPMRWPIRTLAMYPGMRQMWNGLKSGAEAARGGTDADFVGDLPKISAPVDPLDQMTRDLKMGDKFSDLSATQQDAVRSAARNQGSSGQPVVIKHPPPSQPPITSGIINKEESPVNTEGIPIKPPESKIGRRYEGLGMHGGVENTSAVRPIDEGLANLRGGLEKRGMLKPGLHLGEEPGANYPERWAGTDSPTIRSTTPQTKILKPEQASALKTPEQISAAQRLAKEMNKK